MFEKILVCLDGSQLAEQILPYATEQAMRFNGELTLLHVMTVPQSVYKGERGISAGIGDIMDERLKEQEAEIQAYMDDIAGQLQEKGIALESVIIRPAPVGDSILNYARDNAMDLICIATHGRGGLDRAAFGSVADHVLRESGCPMLVIKPQHFND